MAHLKSTIIFLLTVSFFTTANATEYIVKIKNKTGFLKSASAISSIPGLEILDTHHDGKLIKIDTKSGAEISMKQFEALSARSDVEYVVKNIQMHAFDLPSDPRFGDLWHLPKINAEQAWAISKGSADVIVAVIDTGVDISHEDLNANAWVNKKEIAGNNIDDDNNGFIDDINGWDFHGNDNNPTDETSAQNPGHGTHVAGIIGAVGNNSIGICGVNQKVSIMPIRFLGKDGSGDLFASVKAIDYAIANGANVINASWGATAPRATAQPIIDAIDRARSKGVIFVAAASNDGRSNDVRDVFPANAGLDNMISVAASDKTDAKPS